MYKILTSIIGERTYTFLNEHQLLPSEQKGYKRGSYGCKDQLLINKMILEDCNTKKKNLSTAWIDYKKAFDSVPVLQNHLVYQELVFASIAPSLTAFLLWW